MEKRGQITLYIILGIVILLLFASFLYIRSIVVEKELEPEAIPAITEIPSEVRPVRLFIEDCIYAISEDAFRKIGDRGGYINPSDYGIVTSSINPTEAEGLKFSLGSDMAIPYWHFLKSPNKCTGDCSFSSMRPSLTMIESQAKDYINKKLISCLNYESFIEQGFEIQESPASATVRIEDFDISIFVNYPVEIKRGDISHRIEDFYVSLPVEFKRIYNFATEITNTQVEYNFLENQILNVISAFASTDSDALPPKTDMEFNFAGGTIWSKTIVKQDVQSLLMTYTGALQIPFTLNHDPRIIAGDDVKTAFYAMDVPLNYDKKYNDFGTTFDYLGWWPIYFDLDCKGDICEPEKMNNPLLTLVGVQRYSFSYDISFPTVVDISDPYAFDRRGYSFKFALEGNVRNNQPIVADFPGYETSFVPTGTQFCDFDLRNSGDISIKIEDALDPAKGISKVQVTYTCGEESCFTGMTDENGELTTKLPGCLGGVVSFIHNDYFIPAKPLTTRIGRNEFVVTQAYPYANINITVKSLPYTIRSNKLSDQPIPLREKEIAILGFERIPSTPGDPELVSAVQFKGNQTEPSVLQRIVPGTYELTGNVILKQKVVIPKDKRSTGADWISRQLGAKKEYTIPKVVFDEYPSGGAILNEKTGPLEVTPKDLYESKEIIFYVISPNLPRKVEEAVPNIEKLSAKFRKHIEPEYE